MEEYKSRFKEIAGEEGSPEEPQNLLEELRAMTRHLFDLEKGSDIAGTIKSIKDNKEMTGANVWLLMAAIMVASIGLDQNSQAVIIGAMLISPLMSPILGMGLAVGVNDKETLMKSLTHLGSAVIVSLIVSTLYFILTPLGQMTEQIEARTQPHILDVGVAFFGGVAGIVSGTRKDKSNAIPGVAIATALLPPLCVAGFGIANLNFSIFIKSFYLFFLNSAFVALATIIIVKILKFPLKVHQSSLEQKLTNRYIIGFSILVLLPSLFFMYGVIRNINYNRQVDLYVKANFDNENYHYVYWKTTDVDTCTRLTVYMMGKTLPEDTIRAKSDLLESYGIRKTELALVQDVPDQNYEMIREEFFEKLDDDKEVIDSKELEISKLQAKLDSIQADTLPYFDFVRKARTVFPELRRVGFSDAVLTIDQPGKNKEPVLLVEWSDRPLKKKRAEREAKLAGFTRLHFSTDTVRIVSY